MPTTDITWQDLTNAIINGSGDLEKNAGSDNCFTNASGTGDAGARSVQTVTASDGNWEFRCTLGPLAGPSGRTFVGISRGTFSLDFTTWDYCIHVSTESNTSGTPHPPNSVFIYEGSPPNKTYLDGVWDEGKLLRIVCTNNVVRYYLDSLLIYTSSKTPIYPFYAVASLACLNKTVLDPQFITGTTGGGSNPCEEGGEHSLVEACGYSWTIPSADPLPLPGNGGPIPSYFEELEPEWGEIESNFPSGRVRANTIQTAPVRRFAVEWQVDQDDAQELDEHHENARGGLKFTLVHPYTAETITGVRYEDYSRDEHNKVWLQTRSARLVKYTN
jgi:hypothetical protein